MTELPSDSSVADQGPSSSHSAAYERSFASPAQVELLSALAQLKDGARLARIYEGALRAFTDENNPECLAQTAHSIRELLDYLPYAVRPGPPRTATLTEQVRSIADPWALAMQKPTALQSADWSGEIDGDLRALLKRIAKFFKWFEEEHPKHRIERDLALDLFDPSQRALPKHLRDLRREPLETVHGYMNGVAHHTKQPTRAEFAGKMAEAEGVVRLIVKPQPFADRKEIDEVLQVAKDASPTAELLDRAVSAMSRLIANHAYFFEKNDSPLWIEPLAARGFFTNPEPPIDRGDGMRSYPVWPESQYLARIAGSAPALVTKVLLSIPPTSNVFIHGDMIDAALSMPRAHAAQVSEAERDWIRTQNQLLWLLPHRYADLVAYLAEHGETDEAFRLARTLLAVWVGPDLADASEDETRHPSREPLARMQQWDYQEAAKKIVPALQGLHVMKTMALLAGLLHEAMDLAEPIDNGDLTDNSYIWRPAVEDHEQNGPEHSIRDVLVTATRDCALVAASSDDVQSVVAELAAHERSVFRRIALSVLAAHAVAAKELAIAWLTSWDNLNDSHIRHEYALLARSFFTEVPDEGKVGLLEHLRVSPQMDNFRRKWTSLYGREPTEDEVQHSIDGMELKKLAILSHGLPPEWRARYEELVARHGAPEHPEFSAYGSSGWVGPTSPKTADDMSTMEVADLVAFLESWQPVTGEMFADTMDGLGRQLSTTVAANPATFAANAAEFAGLDSTYVRSVIDGLDQALSSGKTFDWPAVLGLAQSVVTMPPTKQEEEVGGWSDRDPGWRWARGSVAHLLGEGFLPSEGEIPIELRDLAWKILEPLTHDREPDADHEARFGGTNMDPLTLSINTNRGKAMHAAIRYGLWVRRHDEVDHPDRVEAGFEAMPELRTVLDAHLDPSVDASQAIRSVYGERLPWLVLLDASWVTANLARLFPGDTDFALLRAAVWETYLVNAPYDNVFHLLRGEYQRAVSELPRVSEPTDRRRFVDPVGKLAEHLVLLYWRGRVSWESHDGMLQKLFDAAPDNARAYAMEFVGRTLWKGPSSLFEGQAERLQDLWDRRFAAFEADNSAGHKEIGRFGWWFASSGKLPDEWLLKELLRVLEAGVPIDAGHLVLERLADLASAHTFESIRATRLMIRASPEAHFLVTTNEQLRRIVSEALRGDNQQARAEASDLMNELAAKGYRGLDELGRHLQKSG